MKIAQIFKVLLGVFSLNMSSCSSWIGPAFPERDGRAFLEKKNYPTPIIEAVVADQKISRTDFEKLRGEKSTDVRFLIARNPHLPSDLLDRLIRDDSFFVRGGAASNRNLSPAQIAVLMNDPDITTLGYLAGNPKVSESDLIRLHEEKEVSLINFAMNPKCPESLKAKMRAEKDELTLHWLEETQKAAKKSN